MFRLNTSRQSSMLLRIFGSFIVAFTVSAGCGNNSGSGPPEPVVTISGPATCLVYCKGEAPTIELKAESDERGGLFRWDVDSETGASVEIVKTDGKCFERATIRGTSKSIEKNDVVVSVEHRKGGKSLGKAVHKITVQHPSLATRSPLIHKYEKDVLFKDGVLRTVTSVEPFFVKVHDQFGVPISNLHCDENVEILWGNDNTPPSVDIAEEFMKTGDSDTDDFGHVQDVYYIPLVGELQDVEQIVIKQTLIYGENINNCCTAINRVILTNTSARDSYPIIIP